MARKGLVSSLALSDFVPEEEEDCGWISPRPTETRDSLRFKTKMQKPKRTKSKTIEEDIQICSPGEEELPKPRPPIVLHSPRKPFIVPEQEDQTAKKKAKRRSFMLGKVHTKSDPSKGGSDVHPMSEKRHNKKSKLNTHVGDFLLSAEREGFLNVREKNSKKWHRRWVALSNTLRCHKDIFSEPLLEIKLAYAAVKKNAEKPTQFEIITSGGTFVLYFLAVARYSCSMTSADIHLM